MPCDYNMRLRDDSRDKKPISWTKEQLHELLRLMREHSFKRRGIRAYHWKDIVKDSKGIARYKWKGRQLVIEEGGGFSRSQLHEMLRLV